MRLSRRIAGRAEHLDDETAGRMTEEAYRAVASSRDVEEGLRAFAEKRAPVYKGR